MKEFTITSARVRTAVLVGCVVVGGLLIFQAAEQLLANRWVNSSDPRLVERGAVLVPSNGSAWDHLGHMRQWSLRGPDLQTAIADYRKALRDDPNSAQEWLDLASADEAAHDDAGARDAYAHAEAAYPGSAQVALYRGNFLLRSGDPSAGYLELRRAVQIDPSLARVAISRAWISTHDASQITAQILPPRANVYWQAIDYFASIDQCDAALAVWSRLSASGVVVALPRAFSLLDELIRENRGADARRVWLRAVSAAKLSNVASGSLVWNGDFADGLTGGGLGWRWDPVLGAYLSFEAAPPQGGSRALRLDFNGGSNIDLQGPYEYVPVAPGQRYHFHALMRTDQITTESGPRFWIADPDHQGAVNVMTDNFTGTHPWTPVHANFTAGPQTQFVVVRLVRPPSRLFDNKLGGTVSIANLSIVPSNGDADP